jgi:Domain of unknown function (DUF1877)
MDKEWGGIQFLLNGDPDSTKGPYGQVIFGGQEIGPNMGYGPARVLNAKQVAEIASPLKNDDEPAVTIWVLLRTVSRIR